jgi:hypothetical protein
LRDGSIGLAPVSAVLGFLRTEGDAYAAVVSRAGTLAAAWTVASLPPLQRRFGASLPQMFRAKFALRLVRRIIRDVLASSSASTRLKRGTATVRIQSSLFCKVRTAAASAVRRSALAVEALVLRRVLRAARLVPRDVHGPCVDLTIGAAPPLT